MGAETEATQLRGTAAVASLAAVGVLLLCALAAPAKNWLLDYYPNPAFQGEVRTRAWVRRVNFEVPGDLLLGGVPDRAEFSVRFQSCLRLSEQTDLAIRLNADDSARLYVDGKFVLDANGSGPTDEANQDKKKARKDRGKTHIDVQPGSHLIMVEYSNAGGAGSLRLELSEQGVRDSWLQSRLRRPSLNGQCDTA